MSFKICTIGCGAHSTVNHGPSYKKYSSLNPDVQLAACCDIDEKKAARFQESFGFQRYYINLHEMLSKEKPDAVCLVSPVNMTFGLASAILEMGYPLILEKPPGTCGDEVRKLAEIAGKKKIPTRVAFNRRFAPLERELKRLLSANFKPEEIHNINCEMFRVERRDDDFSTTAIHVIDSVRFLANSDYRSIRFYYQELPLIGPGVVNIYMDCIFESGATAHFAICPVSGVCIERTIISTYNNTFFLNAPMWSEYDHPGRLIHLQGNKVLLDSTGKDISDGDEVFEYIGIYDENASFFDAIRSGRRPECDLASAIQSVEVAECIRNRAFEYTKQ